jgi:hypothetical protein
VLNGFAKSIGLHTDDLSDLRPRVAILTRGQNSRKIRPDFLAIDASRRALGRKRAETLGDGIAVLRFGRLVLRERIHRVVLAPLRPSAIALPVGSRACVPPTSPIRCDRRMAIPTDAPTHRGPRGWEAGHDGSATWIAGPGSLNYVFVDLAAFTM